MNDTVEIYCEYRIEVNVPRYEGEANDSPTLLRRAAEMAEEIAQDPSRLPGVWHVATEDGFVVVDLAEPED